MEFELFKRISVIFYDELLFKDKCMFLCLNFSNINRKK